MLYLEITGRYRKIRFSKSWIKIMMQADAIKKTLVLFL